MSLSGFMITRVLYLLLVSILSAGAARSQSDAEVKAHYQKSEQMIQMRDGVKLFTSIYVHDHAQPYALQRCSLWTRSLQDRARSKSAFSE